MTRTEIRLDTLTDVNKFVETMTRLDEPVWLEDGDSIRVSARSMLACLYSLEWQCIYVLCERDINVYLMPWIV